MSLVMGYFTIAVFIGSWIGGIGFLVYLTACVFRIPMNAKPGSVQRIFKLNPLNLIFSTDRLTVEGQRIRKRAIFALLASLLCFTLGGIVGLLGMTFGPILH